jgi:Lrp/AsnC family transcriptional regulator, leucine-responsive regulatory protein
MLDDIDSKALTTLTADARVSWADLGAALGLSAPAAAERVRKLQERGLVRGFTAVVDPDAAGFPVLAFVAVTLARQDVRRRFVDAVRAHPLIQECHHVAGDDDFLLKVRARSLAELDTLLSEELKGRLGIARTRTTIVLGTAKETARLPIGDPAAVTAQEAKSSSRRRPRPRR